MPAPRLVLMTSLRISGRCPLGVLMEIFSRSDKDDAAYCGVCVTTLYVTPVFGSSQNEGVVWKLPLKETSRLLATLSGVKPLSTALVRFTVISIRG